MQYWLGLAKDHLFIISTVISVLCAAIFFIQDARRTRKKNKKEAEREKNFLELKRAGFQHVQFVLAENDVPFVFEDVKDYSRDELKGCTKGTRFKSEIHLNRSPHDRYEVRLLLNRSSLGTIHALEMDALQIFHGFLVSALQGSGAPSATNTNPFPWDLAQEWPQNWPKSGLGQKLFGVLIRYEELWNQTEEIRRRFIEAHRRFREEKKTDWEELKAALNRISSETPAGQKAS